MKQEQLIKYAMLREQVSYMEWLDSDRYKYLQAVALGWLDLIGK